ncbi:hypothetical protein ACLBXM_19925 [Xanthobacteraceae bacterium A53D]
MNQIQDLQRCEETRRLAEAARAAGHLTLAYMLEVAHLDAKGILAALQPKPQVPGQALGADRGGQGDAASSFPG